MLELSLRKPAGAPIRLLCLGAHSDDIEIGCGGTILTLLAQFDDVEVHWIVFSASEARAGEARTSARAFLSRARKQQVRVHDFRDGFFPYLGGQIKDQFELLKEELSPDLVFTHHRDDRHQDHRLISDLTWNTFRNHFILEYEIPKYDGDLGAPNFFVPLLPAVCSRKIQLIIESFVSQRRRQWFDEETFLAILRLRGMEASAPSRFAEAFYARKTVLEGLNA
jgi:LmbE family N-acetylglucosaminyl deacetylase